MVFDGFPRFSRESERRGSPSLIPCFVSCRVVSNRFAKVHESSFGAHAMIQNSELTISNIGASFEDGTAIELRFGHLSAEDE